MGLSASEGLANRMFQAGLVIDKYYTPLLCLFGALGNSLSLAVFYLDSKYRSQSSSYYLSALAVTDTGFLLNLFAVWLDGVLGGIITWNFMCPLVMYLGQVTSFLSIYLMIAFSIERYVAVHYPFARPRICTKSKAKKTILGVATVALLLFSYTWFIAKVVEIKPKMGKNSVDGHRMWPSTAELNSTNTSFITEDTVNFSEQGMRILLLDHVDGYGAKGGEEKKNVHQNFLRTQAEETLKEVDNVKKSKIKHYKGSNTVPEMDDEKKQKRLLMVMNMLEYMPLVEKIRKNDVNQLNNNDPTLSSLSFWDPDKSRNGEESDSLLASNFSEQADNFTTITTTSLKNFTTECDNNRNNNGGRCRYRCTVPKQYYKISEIANYSDTIITLIIPFILITFLNVRISISVWKLMNERHQIVASQSCQTSSRTTTVVVRNTSRFGRHSSSLSTVRKNDDFPHDAPPTSDFHLCSNSSNCQPFDDDNISEIDECHCQFHSQNKVITHDRLGNNSPLQFNQRKMGSEQKKTTLHEGTGHHLVLRTVKNASRTSTCDESESIVTVTKRFNRHRATYHHQSSSEVRVTKTLLLVSTVFLFLNLPLHVIRCAQFIQRVRGTNGGKEILRAIQPWATLLFNTNFAVNFLLYCVSGRNFRKSLRLIVSRLLTKVPQQQRLQSFHSSHNHRISNSYRQKKFRDFGEMVRGWRKPRSRDRAEIERKSKCQPSNNKRSQRAEMLELEEISILR